MAPHGTTAFGSPLVLQTKFRPALRSISIALQDSCRVASKSSELGASLNTTSHPRNQLKPPSFFCAKNFLSVGRRVRSLTTERHHSIPDCNTNEGIRQLEISNIFPDERVAFSAAKDVRFDIIEHDYPLDSYLSKPERIVTALTKPGQVTSIGPDLFRLRLKPLPLLSISIEPIVDMRIWKDQNGVIRLKSVGFELRNLDFVSHKFTLNVSGHLAAQKGRRAHHSIMSGTAKVQVSLLLPAVLMLTPRMIIDAAGNGVCERVLDTFEERLVVRLPRHYNTYKHRSVTSAVP